MKYYIDGSNIGRLVKEKQKVILLEVVLSLCHHILLQGDDFICYFDANARHILEKDKKPIYDLIINSKRFKLSPPRNQADIYILDDATDDVNRGEKVIIISNDLYRDFLDPKDPRYKPEFHKYSWVSTEKGTLHSGNISHYNDKKTIKILSLGFVIPVENDVRLLLPILIQETNSKRPECEEKRVDEQHIDNLEIEKEIFTSSDSNQTISNEINIGSIKKEIYKKNHKSKLTTDFRKIILMIMVPAILFLIINIVNQHKDERDSYYGIPLNCGYCGGSRYFLYQNKINCNICKGSGKKICSNCKDIKCSQCKGTGKIIKGEFIKCHYCNGTGEYTE